MPAEDRFALHSPGSTSPIENGFDVAPDDGADVAWVTRALMVTVSGDVAVTLRSGSDITLAGLLVGVMYPFRVSRVKATGTTATGIKGFY